MSRPTQYVTISFIRNAAGGRAPSDVRAAITVSITLIFIALMVGVIAPIAHVDFGLPTLPVTERIFPIDEGLRSIDTTAQMNKNGSVDVTSTVRFSDTDGGDFILPQECDASRDNQVIACTSDVRLDGATVSMTQEPGLIRRLNIPSQEGTLTYIYDGTVEGWTDLTVLDLPLLYPLPEASINNPLVRVNAVLELPGVDRNEIDGYIEGGAGEPRFIRRDGGVTVRMRASSFSGTTKVTYAFPVSVTPKLSPLEVFGSSGQLSFNLEKEIINKVQSAIRDPLTVSYGTPKFFNLLIFALALIPPLVMWMFVIARGFRLLFRRKPKVTEDILEHPPSEHDPAIVALLEGNGRVPEEAVAGSLLSLAEKGAIDFQDLGETRFVARVKSTAEGRTPGEDVLLQAMRAEAGADGTIEGPPMLKDPASYWKGFRNDTRARALFGGLVYRVGSANLLIVAILLTITSYLATFVFPSIFFQTIFLAPIVIIGVSRNWGASLTPDGVRLRDLWEAYGRFIRQRTSIESVPPSGITVWGERLSYGAALGVAERSAKLLTPEI
jgi:Predicted membrane protein (DUF2207)